MANDTAMTKQESEVMIEQLKKIFEVVRLLDGDELETGNLKDLANADGFPCKCYDFWKKGTRCKNCTSKEALQKKEKFDMEGRIFSFCCGAAGFWRDLCGDPHRGADPEAGQCTAS